MKDSHTFSSSEHSSSQPGRLSSGLGVGIHEVCGAGPAGIDLKGSVARLLREVPEGTALGLGSINLRGAGNLTRRERLKRQKRRSGGALLGTYYKATPKAAASIDLFVDEICRDFPPILLRIPLILDTKVGSVLYHELGHHVDSRTKPGVRSGESAAETWRRKQFGEFLRRRYWYLRLFGGLFRAAGRLLKRLSRTRQPTK